VDMPEGAVLTAAVDGEAVGPRPLGADRFALPLPSGEGLRRVRLRWVFAEGTETLLRPRLAAPKLDAAPELIWYGSVTLPSGYGLAATWPPAIRPGALAAAQEELARAEALASVARLLIERFPNLRHLSIEHNSLTVSGCLDLQRAYGPRVKFGNPFER